MLVKKASPQYHLCGPISGRSVGAIDGRIILDNAMGVDLDPEIEENESPATDPAQHVEVKRVPGRELKEGERKEAIR